MAHNAYGGSEAARYFASSGAGTSGDPIIPVVSVGASAGSQVTLTDRSGTITAGGTAQTLMALNAARKGFYIQNTSSADLWFSSVGTAAVAGSSMRIVSGALYECPSYAVPTSAISIYGATTGQSFAAREF